MIIFFQAIKGQFAFIILLLPIFIIIQACNGHTSVNREKITMIGDTNFSSQHNLPSSEIVKSPVVPGFLDTIKLNEMGISYKILESNLYYDKWIITLTDTIPKSKQIQQLIYQMTTKIRNDDDYVLFQLDSLFVKLPNKYQAFGFNEGGPYVHSYEALPNPNILFDDYNFDGYIDFSVQSGGSGTNEYRFYHIFNPKKERFNNSIEMSNASFDKSNKLVYQTNHVSSAEGGRSTFRFTKEDTLIMIKSVNTDYIDSLDSYVKETKLIQADGTYSINYDTIKRK